MPGGQQIRSQMAGNSHMQPHLTESGHQPADQGSDDANRQSHHRPNDDIKSPRSTTSRRQSSAMELLTTSIAGDKVVIQKKEFIYQRWFKAPILLCIFLDTMTIGFAAEPNTKYPQAWKMLANFFTAVFFGEMVCKLYVLRRGYWKEKWNRLDGFIAVFGVIDYWFIVPAGYESNLIKMLRVFCVSRLLRLMREFHELWYMFCQILDAFKGMFWIAVLLGVLVYSFAIICVIGIGDGGKDTYPGYDTENMADWATDGGTSTWNNYQYFGTMSRAMYTLFCIAILAEWPEIGRSVFEYQPGMICVFIIFIILTTFGVMNVFIGVIVESTMKAFQAVQRDHRAHERTEKLELLQCVNKALFSMDTDGDACVDYDEFEKGLETDQVALLLKQIHLPDSFNTQKIMDLLDQDADGEVTSNEFVRSFYELIYNDSFQNHCVLLASCNAILREVKTFKVQDMQRLEQRLDERLDDIVLAYRNLVKTLETMAPSQTMGPKPADQEDHTLVNGNLPGVAPVDGAQAVIGEHNSAERLDTIPERVGNVAGEHDSVEGLDLGNVVVQVKDNFEDPVRSKQNSGANLVNGSASTLTKANEIAITKLIKENMELKDRLEKGPSASVKTTVMTLVKENELLKGRLIERDVLVEKIMEVLSKAVFIEDPSLQSGPPREEDRDFVECSDAFAGAGDFDTGEPESPKSKGISCSQEKVVENLVQGQRSRKPRQPGQSQGQNGVGAHKTLQREQLQAPGGNKTNKNALRPVSSQKELDQLQQTIASATAFPLCSSAAGPVQLRKGLSTDSEYREKILNLINMSLSTSPPTLKQWQSISELSTAGNATSRAEAATGRVVNPEDFETDFLVSFLESVMPGVLKFAKEEGLLEDGHYLV